VTRAAKVAYRQGGSIYVADEDGGSPKQVTQAADGVFALSPDGHTLAVARGGSLLVYDVASGKLNFSALAEKVPPVWLPDSSAVMFMRVGTDGAPRIYRVPSSGGSEVALGTGVEVAVSPNGADLALLPSADSGGPLLLSRNGGPFTPVTVPGGDPLEVAFGGGRLFVSTISASQGGEIWSLSPDGSDATRLVKPGSGSEKGATFGRLLVSPSGSSLLYAAESDDGYSRMWIVPAAGGTPLSLSSRRDNYPLQWSISGKEILFIEGNAFQGEPTSLLRVSPSGSRRLSLVSGAGL
jgi:Tol biopolymer transport system component